jgi:hypothetical protein
MRWNRTELLDKLHIGGMFILLLFVGFLSGAFAFDSAYVFGAFVVAWRGGALGG